MGNIVNLKYQTLLVKYMKDKYGPALPKGTKFEIVKPTGDYAHEISPQTAYAVDF